jgi:TldD protein
LYQLFDQGLVVNSKHRLIALTAAFAFLVCPSFGQTTSRPAVEATPAFNSSLSSDSIVQTLEHELKRSMANLKGTGKAKLYYLAYRLYTGNWDSIVASDGALKKGRTGPWRMLGVDLRIGSPRFDNTHYMRSDGSSSPAVYENASHVDAVLPLDAGLPLEQCLWLKTDEAFKSAQQRFTELAANNEVYSIEEDRSGDFSLLPPHHFQFVPNELKFNRSDWEERLRRLSKVFLSHPSIDHSWLSFSAEPTTRFFVNSENSEIVEKRLSYEFSVWASSLADDGMNLWLMDSIEVPNPAFLPDEAVLKKRVERVANSLEELRKAPIAEAYVGPAILSGKAAAVFFHETFGHRIEAIHQKSETEGKTFAKRIGTSVMPNFVSVVDDPTAQKSGAEWLCGHYVYDDEGAPAQKVSLAKNGILTGFLMGRVPLQNSHASNGHGRSSPGWNPTGRQGNLFVTADKSKQVSEQVLRQMLIGEARKQHKSYGLLFDEISGGYTYTARGSEQTYTINPLVVYKVFVDGRPDQLIRGADIVGTPLAALERIIAAGTEYQVFNGRCGRDSGPVPVSAVAPSLLVQSIEIKKSAKSFEKPPILPDPTPSIHPNSPSTPTQ